MNTAGGFRVSTFSLDKRYIIFKLHEMKYLFYIFYMVHNQMTRYTEAMDDVRNYINIAFNSIPYVEPSSTANRAIIYY